MRRLALSALVIVSSACIVQAPTSEGTQNSAPKAPSAPPVEVRSGANFGDKTELTSVVLAPGRGMPGESMRVIANFKVNAPIESDYIIFVHVEDVDGRIDRLNVDHTPGRGALPTSKWKAGDLVRDEFEIPIPPGYNVRGLNLFLGFWDPRTDARLKVVNADKVRTDGRDRLLVASFPVGAAQ